MKSLSVIIIGKNEEAYIAECLASVIEAVAQIGDAEVVYVDSASTDRTVEIARSLGVRVVSLRPEWKLSPSAGRYVGFHHTTGDVVMFVDGDTMIEADWLRNAVPWFDRAEIAGVTGYLDDLDKQGRKLPYVGTRSQEARAVNELRGSGLYRRAAMERAGTFNPLLVAEEEAELGMRLRRAGWKLLALPHPMGCHRRGAPRLAELWRNWRLGRVLGNGLTWRYAMHEGLGLPFFFVRFRPTVLFALTCLLLSPGLFLWNAGHTRIAGFFLTALAAWMAAIAIKKRSLAGPLDYVTYHTLALFGLIAGAINARLEDPQAYPLDVIEAPDHPAPHTQSRVALDFSNTHIPRSNYNYE